MRTKQHNEIGVVSIGIPKEIENLALPDPALLQYYIDDKNRVIWLETDVDWNCIEIIKQILRWNREDDGKPVNERKAIRLCIFSNGGDLDMNNSIVDVIKLSQTPIYGINMGVAASAACYIFMACHKRYALRNSYFLLHQGGAENISGTFVQVVAMVDEYQKKIEKLYYYILENSKIPEKELEENIMGEWYMSAEDALKYGVCDKLVDNVADIL